MCSWESMRGAVNVSETMGDTSHLSPSVWRLRSRTDQIQNPIFICWLSHRQLIRYVQSQAWSLSAMSVKEQRTHTQKCKVTESRFDCLLNQNLNLLLKKQHNTKQKKKNNPKQLKLNLVLWKSVWTKQKKINQHRSEVQIFGRSPEGQWSTSVSHRSIGRDKMISPYWDKQNSFQQIQVESTRNLEAVCFVHL